MKFESFIVIAFTAWAFKSYMDGQIRQLILSLGEIRQEIEKGNKENER